MKYLGTKLTRNMQNPPDSNYKTFLKDTQIDLNKQKDISRLCSIST
jgi:hypothetical protein